MSGSTFDGNSVTGTSPGFGGAIDVGSSTGLTTTLDRHRLDVLPGREWPPTAARSTMVAAAAARTRCRSPRGTFTGNAAASGGDVIASNDDEAPGGTVVDVAADVFAGSCYSGTTTTPAAWSDAGDNAGTDTSCFPAGTTHDVIAASVGDDLSPLGSFGGPLPTVLVETGDPALGLVPVGDHRHSERCQHEALPDDRRARCGQPGGPHLQTPVAVQQSLPAISARCDPQRAGSRGTAGGMGRSRSRSPAPTPCRWSPAARGR